MREVYQSELDHRVEDLVAMAEQVRVALDDASTALLSTDLALAERVITADAHVDRAQMELDEKIVELLARQAPVAGDLRLLLAALRMSSSLERMGDLAVHVAVVARRRFPDAAVPARHREEIGRMADLSAASVQDAARVIADRDLQRAGQVERRDDTIDEIQQQLYRSVSRAQDYTSAQIMDLTLLARFYERVGDHAVSLVRRVGFLVTGDSIDARPGDVGEAEEF
jgi:phosphate transport system protein